MSRKRKDSKDRKSAPLAKPIGTRKTLKVVLPAVLMGVLGIAAYFALFSGESTTPPSPTTPSAAYTATSPGIAQKPKTLDGLLAMSPEELTEVDIAELNLLCASGLPGAETLDTDHCLATLGRWAKRVRSETDRYIYRFRQDPASYENSEGYFRMLTLITVLQQDFGVKYNPDRIRNIDFKRSQDLFIHGMIGSDNGGTCVSMPVIYTAVASRLGYPVKLVLTRAHVFCRWDGPDDRFNIEATNQGMHSFPDDYYLTWPEKITDAEAKASHYLVSLSPAEELASFLASRGHCLLDNGRTKEALDAYNAAHRFAPDDPAYLAWARDTQRRLQPHSVRRRNDPLAEIEGINAINRANARRTQTPVPGAPQPERP